MGWVLEELHWTIVHPILIKLSNNKPNEQITIGVTTFMDRFNNCLKPLIKKLVALFPNQQIVIIANGHVKQEDQKKYLDRITKFLEKFPNVELVALMEPRGLSHLWNSILGISKNSKVLLLNDDIRIKIGFPKFIYFSGIFDQEIATINSSWSHFLISKKIFQAVGPFDEGLKEIGGEDDDYAARLALKGIKMEDFSTQSIAGKLRRKKRLVRCNSYGKDMNIEPYGYSSVNSKYLADKWESSMEYFDGAVLVPTRSKHYWKLRLK